MEIAALKAYFEGEWKLERRIYEHGLQTLQAIAKGYAYFCARQDTSDLYYREEGRLFLLDKPSSFSFFRQFRYAFGEKALSVYFLDGPNTGSLYQTYQIESNTGRLAAEKAHHCGPDFYDGVYHLGDRHFELKTRIEGERKDLFIVTQFIRCSST